MLQAKAFGYDTLAITDHNTLTGVTRAHARARESGYALLSGAGWTCVTLRRCWHTRSTEPDMGACAAC